MNDDNKTGQVHSEKSIAPEQLNSQQGMAGSLIEKLIDMKNCKWAHSNDAAQHTTQQIQSAREAIAQSK